MVAKKLKKLNALLEIGTEEIPARFVQDLLDDLQKKAAEQLAEARIEYVAVKTLGTYRRLTLYIEGIASQQTDLSQEVKGPSREVAFDKEGKPTKAAIGFAKSRGVMVKDLVIKTEGPKEYVFAQVFQKGLATEKVLKEVFPKIITSLYLPLAMRWGEGDFKFIRPIHWFLALLGNKNIKFTLAGINSSSRTFGHRYLKSNQINFSAIPIDLVSYLKKLKAKGVMVDQDERRAKIKDTIEVFALRKNAKALIENDLLEEVVFLVESPSFAVGKIDKKFLDLPAEVLITSLKKNQKCFPIADSKVRLLPLFVVVVDSPKALPVAGGNERVVAARLSDAVFFFNEDRQITLDKRVESLKQVSFLRDLGSMFDKKERVKKTAAWLAKQFKFGGVVESNLSKAADLYKADLTTKMVFEFTDLQGIMGREYALLQGADQKVAEAIYEHYLPRFNGDSLPSTKEGILLAIADKFDYLIGCFSVGLVPSGSADPFGLRRTALGLVQIILAERLNLDLEELFEKNFKLYADLLRKNKKQKEFAEAKATFFDFIRSRVKHILLEKKYRYDVVDASLGEFNNICDAFDKAKIVTEVVETEWFRGIFRSADRVIRLGAKATRENVIPEDLVDPEEIKIHDLYLKINWTVEEKINQGDFKGALEALAEMTAPLEEFFNKVLVICEDERLKTNRLALLKTLERMYQNLLDFTKFAL